LLASSPTALDALDDIEGAVDVDIEPWRQRRTWVTGCNTS